MLRSIRFFSPIACLVALAIFAAHAVKADNAAATQPSAANGTIVVTVVDSDSKPVVKARVQLFSKKKVTEGDDAGAAPAKPKAIARGATHDDGKFTFSSVASGEYRVSASQKKMGTKGSATVTVADDSPNATVTITLSAPSTDNGGGATTAPSTPPAQ